MKRIALFALLCAFFAYARDQRPSQSGTLLPVGEKAQFHIEKDYMKLRVEDLDDKEREYIVVSMTPRMEAQTADNRK